jgi:enoyl-CoA hydratase/carnithine racemase
MTDALLVDRVNSVLVLRLNRPEQRNTISRDLLDGLFKAFDLADEDDDIRSVVITANGDFFCAGAELSHQKELGRSSRDAVEGAKPRDVGGVLSLRIFDLTKPVLAAVNGAAAGLGATMLLPMDVRIASEKARFGFVHTRRGIVPEGCATWFLPRLVGMSTAARWTYSGRVFDVEEAHAAGLVDEIVPRDRLVDRAVEIAEGLGEQSSGLAVSLTRRMLWNALTLQHPMEAHEVETAVLAGLSGGRDLREGRDAFLEKRRPRFTSRPSQELPRFDHCWNARDFAPLQPPRN